MPLSKDNLLDAAKALGYDVGYDYWKRVGELYTLPDTLEIVAVGEANSDPPKRYFSSWTGRIETRGASMPTPQHYLHVRDRVMHPTA